METDKTEINENKRQLNTYDFPTDDDSPIRKYRPCRKFANQTVSSVEMETSPTYQCGTSCASLSSGEDRVLKASNKGNCLETLSTETISSPCLSSSNKEFTTYDTSKSETGVTGYRAVAYICSLELIERCNRLTKVPMRASMVHSLIEAYGLLKHMRIVSPVEATEEELCVFHTQDYLQFLQQISQQDDEEKFDYEAQEYGLSYDCPVLRDVYQYGAVVAGATLKAAQCLVDEECRVAINWYGGWHHAKKDSASGFCYTNDISLGILKLREKFERVLYIDLDLHHGDGVEDSFCATNKVMTVSVHKHAVGFFPGTGGVDEVGCGRGKYYSVNIPLQDGIQDTEFVALVCRILKEVRERFSPSAVVCQCGADGIAGDPMASFNLTPKALGSCVQFLLSWKLPLLLLGGGGYHQANTARCWTYLTAVVLGRRLPVDIPEHKYLMLYGPGYELGVSPGNKKDENSREYLQSVYRRIMENLKHVHVL